MRCTLFEYSNEDFDTGTVADNIEAEMGYANEFTLESVTGDFTIGENIQFDGSVVGEVIGWQESTVSIRSLTVDLRVGDVLTGETSSATGTIATASDNLDFDDGVSQNDDFELNNGDFLDFSEINPLGEVN
jgi:hypothetical protein